MEIEILLDAVELGQSAFGEAPERFDPVDVNAMGGKMLAFVDPEMLVVANIDQAIVSFPSIRVNNTFRVHLSSNDALECSGRTVGDHFGYTRPLRS